jgi:hypothetical protein
MIVKVTNGGCASTLRLVTTDFALQPLQHKWKQTDGESETTDATSSLYRVKLHSIFQGFIEYNLEEIH